MSYCVEFTKKNKKKKRPNIILGNPGADSWVRRKSDERKNRSLQEQERAPEMLLVSDQSHNMFEVLSLIGHKNIFVVSHSSAELCAVSVKLAASKRLLRGVSKTSVG